MNYIDSIIQEEILNYITENVMNEWDDDIMYDLFYERDEIMRETIHLFMKAKIGVTRQPWSVVPFHRLKKIWEDAAKNGFVRDEKGLNMIQTKMLTNLLKLDVNTELMGHMQGYPDDQQFEDAGTTKEAFEEKLHDINDVYFTDPTNNQWRLSDYGLKPLWEIAEKLTHEHNPMKKLMYLDEMLNVVHMRSDLAAMFVEGGTSALNQLSGFEEVNAE